MKFAGEQALNLNQFQATNASLHVNSSSSIIERAHKKAQSWATMSRIRSFVYQNDIKLGLEQLYRDIDICAQQFSVCEYDMAWVIPISNDFCRLPQARNFIEGTVNFKPFESVILRKTVRFSRTYCAVLIVCEM